MLVFLFTLITPIGYADTNTGPFSDADERMLQADPVFAVLGLASKSHPTEIAEMMAELEKDSVEVVRRKGALAYSPGLRPGQPGQMIVDPDASYSAWLHEFQHTMDDKAIGWGWYA